MSEETYLYEPPGHISTIAISLALDAQLEADERAEFEQHLVSCPACRERWITWQNLDQRLQAEPLVGPMPGFVARFDQRLAARQRRRERLLGGAVLIGGTVSIWSLLLLGLGIVAVFSLGTSPSVRMQAIELVGFGGQLLALVVNNVVALRDGVVGGLPAPALIMLAGAVLLILAFFWLRLIPPSQMSSAGWSGQSSDQQR